VFWLVNLTRTEKVIDGLCSPIKPVPLSSRKVERTISSTVSRRQSFLR